MIRVEMRKVEFDGTEYVTVDRHVIMHPEDGSTVSDVMDLYQRNMPGWSASRGGIV